MTWKEFKDYIDRILTHEGIGESIEIEYIDVVSPKTPSRDDRFNYHVPEVVVKDGTLRIVN